MTSLSENQNEGVKYKGSGGSVLLCLAKGREVAELIAQIHVPCIIKSAPDIGRNKISILIKENLFQLDSGVVACFCQTGTFECHLQNDW